jgi:hypothetical protein
VDKQNLEVLCADPKEGDPRIRHDSTATITPDFMGLAGTLTLKARPESRLLPVVKSIGLKLYGEFNESAASASNDMEPWRRKRFVASGGKTLTGGPAGSWLTETVQLAFISERGDEMEDLGRVEVQVLAAAGTLLPGDILFREAYGTFEVRGVEPQGDFEKARLVR